MSTRDRCVICTKCGADNPDEAPSCQACGHKLQSSRESRSPSERQAAPRTLPMLDTAPRDQDPKLRPYREAWLVGLGAAGAVFLLLGGQLSWPLYLVIALAAAYAWLRGLR